MWAGAASWPRPLDFVPGTVQRLAMTSKTNMSASSPPAITNNRRISERM
jgi:hypothetical protein